MHKPLWDGGGPLEGEDRFGLAYDTRVEQAAKAALPVSWLRNTRAGLNSPIFAMMVLTSGDRWNGQGLQARLTINAPGPLK